MDLRTYTRQFTEQDNRLAMLSYCPHSRCISTRSIW